MLENRVKSKEATADAASVLLIPRGVKGSMVLITKASNQTRQSLCVCGTHMNFVKPICFAWQKKNGK